MLIKTDSQNYTNIANALRELNGSTEQYTPSEMVETFNILFPDCAVSFDTFDSDGNVLTATTYGSIVKGLAHKTKLASVNIDSVATTIGSHAFVESGLTSFIIPESITRIEDHAFYYSDLTSITFHNNTAHIGSYAFAGCDIENLELPESITSIESGSFNYNDAITTLSIPSGITSIEYRAFAKCTSLATVTFKGTPTSMADNVFAECTKLITINVPWAEGEVANAPWGATNATINYNYVEE